MPSCGEPKPRKRRRRASRLPAAFCSSGIAYQSTVQRPSQGSSSAKLSIRLVPSASSVSSRGVKS